MSKTNRRLLFFIYNMILGFITPLNGRSPFRKPDSTIPTLTACWQNAQELYTLRDSHLEEYSLFKTFDEEYFLKHLLPHNEITHRNQETKSVSGKTLQRLVDELIDEIYAGKKNYTNFTVLRARDFNRNEHVGLMVLKFNDYPFVVKLFMEHPQSLTSPYAKGLVPLFSFYMGGGINRHLVGFTRIKNLEHIKNKIARDDHWSKLVDAPRKWFLLPRKARWIELTGTNIGAQKTIKSRLPGTYCIIADAIESDKKTSMLNKEDNHICMSLCKFLNFWIDPHIDNFMWESATNKLVIVDTEHFPSLMGFKEDMQFDSYLEWLGHLSGKFLQDTFFRSKRNRRLAQLQPRVVI